MKVVDIANEIFLETASPSDTTVAAIAFWLRSNVGKLNAILYEDFSVDATTLEILNGDGTEISELAAAILKMMYKVYRVDLDIRATMTSLTTDGIIEAKDMDFSVKRVNRSEVLKTLTAFKKDTIAELTSLVHNYRSYNGAPAQVAGDDTEPGHYVGVASFFTRSSVSVV